MRRLNTRTIETTVENIGDSINWETKWNWSRVIKVENLQEHHETNSVWGKQIQNKEESFVINKSFFQVLLQNPFNYFLCCCISKLDITIIYK